MAITIVATSGSASANSFVTEAEQIDYMNARLNASAWTTTSGSTCTHDEKSAMIEATRELTVKTWDGRRTDATQALSWPRQWAYDPDSPVQDYYGTTIVPQRVKDAAMELAFQFIKAGTTDVAALDATDGIMEKTVDVLTTRYAEPYLRPKGLSLYPRVMALIRPLLVGTAGSTPLVRG